MTFTLLLVGYCLTYAALTGLDDVWNWVVGSVLGLVIASFAVRGRPEVQREPLRGLNALPRLLWGSTLLVATGCLQVVPVVLGLRTWRNVGTVTIDDAAETEGGVAMLALIYTISPGSVASEIDRENRSITFSMLDASEPERVRAGAARFYRRYQKQSVP